MRTVLLIADERELNQWLRDEGALDRALSAKQIAEAADAVKARRRLRGQEYECVCCDLEAVGLHEGLALQKLALKRSPGCEWLWIVPSGCPRKRMKRLNGWPYVEKPLLPGQLTDWITLTLQQRYLQRRELTKGHADQWFGAQPTDPPTAPTFERPTELPAALSSALPPALASELPPNRLARLSASDLAVLQQIFRYVDEHLPTELKRKEIAGLVHFHPVYLSRFFKSRTGTSLSKYIVNRRIERAKTLLAQSELQVNHIVYRLGYYNPSHFTRTFKQATGYTPSQYRSAAASKARRDQRDTRD
ncbi:helix-turn-helix domain-containing protein [Cohnella lubricantis]|uniref:Helix-turn-helix transcriptional regulator n=1 Tax=Cohnella lubricantis TaxID=2163172 RepID=A0A841TBB5_9BACL|nr:helix-turn-helix domain-containing protein [Cohnella lubricantis]MBB6676678.1 helix-turn-helix transcriptional regulator [Cohnella lubricantis]MBP2120609.1 AraC-like DNA-binding protein [Cohnella lubricantis]